MVAKIVYVVPTPSPNRNAEVDRVATVLGSDSLHVVFVASEFEGASAPRGLPDVCEYSCLDDPPRRAGGSVAYLDSLLERLEPKVVVVGGYAHRETRAAIRWCLKRGVPYSLRSDSNIWTDRKKGWAKYLVRSARVRPLVRTAMSCLVAGRFNSEFWKRYGMEPHQEGWWPQWIDYDHFVQARRFRGSAREDLLHARGISTSVNFLYVGRQIRLKKLDRLCNGLVGCRDHVGLILVGKGPESERLKRRFGALLADRLHIVGHVPQDELPRWYAAADAFALASGTRENWGMVINEAVAAGLPILCHGQVGAAGDLLENGRNGVALSTNSTAEWASVMRQVSESPAQLEGMGQESMAIADEWRSRTDPAECTQSLL
jgi:1,2-diacylglycerol 3-alpha-glucosyltransferase